ncbi:lipoate--protein ligase family protein [Terrilactibacillus laevilacticus]|uniref:Biotin/lipoate A/B protein ligase family protein n=1 Tax=Terrilactibacillus laevilacticus TaxID=1380157 RepID=A0ABW5PSI1_9BACI|nr:biotin/lipoate A/B protein ligase family protein [Terrilactibacillus laevilacticus]
MSRETWAFIDSGINTPEYNMAMDECLLEWHSHGELPPIIRFYGWNPPGLSVGYFQKVEKRIDKEAVEQNGFRLVRRPTGGRAVLHDDELTYSVIVSEDHPEMPKSVTQAYRVISEGLLNGFRNLGLQADFAIPEGKTGQTSSAVCFEEPSWYELIVDGKKAAGSAQTRQKGVILQHGSIPLSINENELFSCFIYPNDRVKERAKRTFKDKAVAINHLMEKKVTLDEVKSAFYRGFEEGLHIQLQPYKLTKEQLEKIEDLAENKYKTDAWNYTR